MTISINFHHMVAARAQTASGHSWVTVSTKDGSDLILHLDDKVGDIGNAQWIANVLTEVIVGFRDHEPLEDHGKTLVDHQPKKTPDELLGGLRVFGTINVDDPRDPINKTVE